MFLAVRNYKNRPRKAGVVDNNKVARFFLRHSVYLSKWNIKH